MPVSLPSSAQDRLLVVAPHPDDETIAAGGLIQSSLRAGAAVRVLFATDGDNNPWPQRWLERSWRIGARERERWGARRRAEAQVALGRLGVEGRIADAQFLGWPDQGLTAMLMDDARAIDVLRERIAAYAPSHVALPVLDDAHPDHSAMRVMMELALLQAGVRCVRLGYRVHGMPSQRALPLRPDAEGAARKREALEAYASQLALSRRRIAAMAGRVEAFEVESLASTIEGNPASIVIPHACAGARVMPRDLLLVLATRNGVLRLRRRLPRLATPGRITLADAQGRSLEARLHAHALSLDLPSFARPVLAAWAKSDRRHPRIVIYDREHWSAAASPGSVAAVAAPAMMGS
jgi:LmbE family N-acetylglucosaminyl deacetylase